jgi:hypothetical protein
MEFNENKENIGQIYDFLVNINTNKTKLNDNENFEEIILIRTITSFIGSLLCLFCIIFYLVIYCRQRKKSNDDNDTYLSEENNLKASILGTNENYEGNTNRNSFTNEKNSSDYYNKKKAELFSNDYSKNDLSKSNTNFTKQTNKIKNKKYSEDNKDKNKYKYKDKNKDKDMDIEHKINVNYLIKHNPILFNSCPNKITNSPFEDSDISQFDLNDNENEIKNYNKDLNLNKNLNLNLNRISEENFSDENNNNNDNIKNLNSPKEIKSDNKIIQREKSNENNYNNIKDKVINNNISNESSTNEKILIPVNLNNLKSIRISRDSVSDQCNKIGKNSPKNLKMGMLNHLFLILIISNLGFCLSSFLILQKLDNEEFQNKKLLCIIQGFLQNYFDLVSISLITCISNLIKNLTISIELKKEKQKMIWYLFYCIFFPAIISLG